MNPKTLKPAALLISVILILVVSCEDCPECPTCPDTPTAGSYYVYIADDRQEPPFYIWVADSKNDSLIDSIATPSDSITMMDISPDGNFLATFMPDLDSVYIFDLESKSVMQNLPPGKPFFSPDGQYILIGNIYLERLFKYQVSGWLLIASDTMPFEPRRLFNQSPYICGSQSNGEEYVIYNYQTMAIVKIDSLIRPVNNVTPALDMIPSFDDKYLYFISSPHFVFKLEIESNSIIDSVFLAPGAYEGSLKCIPDGRYLLVSECNNDPNLEVGNLLIIEPDSFIIYQRISTWGLHPYFPSSPLSLRNIAITPDGLKAYCGRGSNSPDPPVSFNLIDLGAITIKNVREGCTAICVAVGKEIQR